MTHAVHTKEKATSVSTPVVAESGIPFVVGTAPIYLAKNPAKVGVPVLITSWDEAVEKLGYSDDWETFTLCEFMYSHFKLYACQPVIFCNVLSIENIFSKSEVLRLSDGKKTIILPQKTISVKKVTKSVSGGEASVLSKGKDYSVFFNGDKLTIEFKIAVNNITDRLTVDYSVLNCSVSKEDIAAGFESVEYCLTQFGIVPDTINCPKYSSDSEIAATMAAKAANINGLFTAKALCDIIDIKRENTLTELRELGKIFVRNSAAVSFEDMAYTGVDTFEIRHTGHITIELTRSGEEINFIVDGVNLSEEGRVFYDGFVKEKIELQATSTKTTVSKLEVNFAITDYTKAIEQKKANNLVNKDQLAFWPMVKLDDRKFHLSTQVSGSMAKIDTENGGIPYESPSNKAIYADSLCDVTGEEIILTHAQANVLNDNGIVTALNFVGGFVLWGNCTACYPTNSDVKDNHIPVSRMFSWVGASLIRTFWSKLDRPMTRRLVDSILDSANIWLNGLVSRGYLLGARVEMIDAENPLTDLMQGIVRLHVYMTPPSATQEIEFTLEYDANYIQAAFA